MKKILKILMIVSMIIGVAFSISNFISIETKASPTSKNGAWVEVNGTWECAGDGSECDPLNGFN
jgi:uncharacterized protein YxeA